MALFSPRELWKLVHPHYIINIALAISFLVLKTVKPLCSLIFEECQLDYWETEILFFTAVIIVFRSRKQGAVNLLPYLGTACMLGKLGSVILWFHVDPLYGVVYVVICLLHLLLLPEPSYQGPENILYFNEKELESQLHEDRRVCWLVELYTAWNPSCIEFASHFAELSAKYGLENLKFGKIDLTRNPNAATQYKINTHALSKQLPTLILFKGGKEYMRRPQVGTKNNLIPFSFTYENVVSTFDLNNLYEECKSNLSKKKSGDGKKESKKDN